LELLCVVEPLAAVLTLLRAAVETDAGLFDVFDEVVPCRCELERGGGATDEVYVLDCEADV